MKHILLIIAITLTANMSFAQTEKETYKVVAAKLVKNYNADRFEIIFSMFSANFYRFFEVFRKRKIDFGGFLQVCRFFFIGFDKFDLFFKAVTFWHSSVTAI